MKYSIKQNNCYKMTEGDLKDEENVVMHNVTTNPKKVRLIIFLNKIVIT